MKKSFLAVAAVLTLTACGTTKQPAEKQAPRAQQQQQIPPQFVFTQEVQGAQQVGKGNTGYRFVLLVPGTTQPAAKQPFVLSHSSIKLPFANNKTENIYRGVTDERGMTPVFVFEGQVPQEGFLLLPQVGKGPVGGWVNLSNEQRQPLVGAPYSMAVCEKSPYLFSALTNNRGQSAYVAVSNKNVKVELLPFSNDQTVRAKQLADACQPAAKAAPAKKAVKKR